MWQEVDWVGEIMVYPDYMENEPEYDDYDDYDERRRGESQWKEWI